MKVYETKDIRNVAVLGHGSAGKTTIVEAAAFVTGVISRMGKVTDGSTISDFDKEEVKRGFSLSTAVVPIEWEGKKIVFGYRPEAIQLGEQKDGYVVTANVELTEMLGDYTNIYITAEKDQGILKGDSHDTPETDIDLTYTIPYDSVYLFDGETEMVIPVVRKHGSK